MNNRERFLVVFKEKIPDGIPVALFSGGVTFRILGHPWRRLQEYLD